MRRSCPRDSLGNLLEARAKAESPGNLMKSAVIVFPGSNCDRDAQTALRQVTGSDPAMVWHKDGKLPDGLDLIVLPGGFSYGDYLRSGAMAAASPIGDAVRAHAARGGYVLAICNGFQVATEMGLLPGALLRNASLNFVCRPQKLAIATNSSAYTAAYKDQSEVSFPVAHHDGNYFADAATLDRLEGEGRVPLCRQSERLRPRHRRHPVRERPRTWHDAPPRARHGGPGRRQ